MKLVILLALAGFALAYVPENPGFRYRITNKLLGGVWNITKRIAEHQLTRDFTGYRQFYRRQKLKVQNLTFGEHELHFAPPNLLVSKHRGGRVIVEKLTRLMDEDGHMRRGIMTITLSNFTTDLIFSFNKTDSDRLAIENLRCQVDVGSVNISLEKFKGATDYMRNVSKAAGPVAAAQLSGMFCPKLRMMMQFMELFMSHYPKERRVAGPIVMDFSLVSQPKATNKYIEFDFSGYSHNRLMQDRMAIQFDPHPLVDKVDNKLMLYGFLSDEVVNQLLKVGQDYEPLVVRTKELKPKSDVFDKLKQLIESSFEGIEVDEDKDIVVRATDAPQVTFLPNPLKPKHHVKLAVPLEVAFTVNTEEDGAKRIKVTVDLEAMLNANLKSEAGKRFPRPELKGHVSKAQVLSIEGAEEEEFSEEFLEQVSEKLKKLLNHELHKLLREAVKDVDSQLDELEEDEGPMKRRRHHHRRHRHPHHRRRHHHRRHPHHGMMRRVVIISHHRGMRPYRRSQLMKKSLSVPNATLEFHRHTVVFGVDWQLDLEGALTKEKRISVDREEDASSEEDESEEVAPAEEEEEEEPMEEEEEEDDSEETEEEEEPEEENGSDEKDSEEDEDSDEEGGEFLFSLF